MPKIRLSCKNGFFIYAAHIFTLPRKLKSQVCEKDKSNIAMQAVYFFQSYIACFIDLMTTFFRATAVVLRIAYCIFVASLLPTNRLYINPTGKKTCHI